MLGKYFFPYVFTKIFPVFCFDIGSDTIKYSFNKNTYVIEKNICTIDTYTNKYVYFGNVSSNLIGRLDENFKIVRNVINGKFVDFDSLAEIISYIFKNIRQKNKNVFFKKPIIVCVAVPHEITEIEINAIADAFYVNGVINVYFFDECFTHFFYLRHVINNISTNTFVFMNLGYGKSFISIVNNGIIVKYLDINLSAEKIRNVVFKYILNKYNVKVSLEFVDKILSTLNLDLTSKNYETLEILGLSMLDLTPKKIKISLNEISQIIYDEFNLLSENIKLFLEKLSPEILTDIDNNGIFILGGLAKITGLSSFLKKMLDTNFVVCNFDFYNLVGLYKIYENRYLFKKLSLKSRLIV
ncbi:MAG: rod shape-determining protein [Candidatus Dojkabacteria bacterium]|nr:rod shape-determining protein [Candidatus Dojkabacteria bacterium]